LFILLDILLAKTFATPPIAKLKIIVEGSEKLTDPLINPPDTDANPPIQKDAK
jgi:hypothetical protein